MSASLLVKYKCFLPDNYQGGSGQWVKRKIVIEEIYEYDVETLLERVNDCVYAQISDQPNSKWVGTKYYIDKIEIVENMNKYKKGE